LRPPPQEDIVSEDGFEVWKDTEVVRVAILRRKEG
jgi:hypothetical protein